MTAVREPAPGGEPPIGRPQPPDGIGIDSAEPNDSPYVRSLIDRPDRDLEPGAREGGDGLVRKGGALRVTNRVQLEMMRGVLEHGAPFRFEALGFSMTPFIQHGDVLTVAPIATRAPRIGDVIAFVQADSDRLAVHRVLALQGETVVARGDNCEAADAIIPRANVLGIVTRIERDGRGVGLALGPARRAIAWLSTREWLLRIRRLLVWTLRPAGALVRRMQRSPNYRAWIKRFRPAFSIEEAGPREMLSVRARLSPGGDATHCATIPGVTNYVAQHGKRVLGYVQLVRRTPDHFPHDGAWLYGLVVWGRYRGMGLGEALARRVLERARQEGAPEVKLMVHADNFGAVSLYRKLGFEPTQVHELEATLEGEARRTGRRSLVMRCVFSKDETNHD